MLYTKLALALLSVVPGISAAPAAKEIPAKGLYQEAKSGTWFENLAVRSNGKILLTSIGGPAGLHQLDPFSDSPKPLPIALFPKGNITARTTTGITEGSPDVFYVAVLEISPTTGNAVKGTNNIMRVTFHPQGGHNISHVAHVPDAILLNGMKAISPEYLVVADPQAGKIFSVNTETGEYSVASADKSFVPPASFPFSVNGLKFRGTDRKYLYYTNTGPQVFGRMPITANGTQAGPVEKLATSNGTHGLYDDFDFGPDGNAYAAIGAANSIQKITFDSKANVVSSAIIAGHLNSTSIAEPTSCFFGRTTKDANTLYVTTAGGTAAPITVKGKSVQVGAQVLAINLA